jgi:hypothetical protein
MIRIGQRDMSQAAINKYAFALMRGLGEGPATTMHIQFGPVI